MIRQAITKMIEAAKLFAAMTITNVDDAFVRFLEWLANDPAGIAWLERRWPDIAAGEQGVMQMQAHDPEFAALVERFDNTEPGKKLALGAGPGDGSRLAKWLAAAMQIIALLKQFGIIPAAVPAGT